jgi:hypothetical protein
LRNSWLSPCKRKWSSEVASSQMNMYIDLPALFCMDLTRSFIWLADHCLEIEIQDDTTCSIQIKEIYLYTVICYLMYSLFPCFLAGLFCSEYHFLFSTTTTTCSCSTCRCSPGIQKPDWRLPMPEEDRRTLNIYAMNGTCHSAGL